MAPKPQQRNGRDGVLSTRLDTDIQVLNLAKDTCGVPPAQVAFGSAGTLLVMIRDTVANKQGYAELGIFCANVCEALERGLNGRRSEELSQSVLGAISKLTTTVLEIQGKISERGKRSMVSRAFHVKSDKDAIAGWKQDLNSILQIFNTELLMNNHTILLDIHRNGLAVQEAIVERQLQPIQASTTSGELPPPPPTACFGRDALIEEIVGLAVNLEPFALIGAGGIGKTSIALAVLHDQRIKDRFGDNRRLIRCDQFTTSRLNFLARLSKAIGAGVDNPEDLTPLQPFLSSKVMILFLDNAESILDPQGTDAREIYTLVGELSRFENICIGITSRIHTVPPKYKRPDIPTLSMESARRIFYGIYSNGGQSPVISDLVRRLDFHALSITLLATTASHNVWNYNRLAKEWDTRRGQVLRTDFNESLAAAIELSLASPTFHKLGSDARELLGVAAFFPQGINEDNLDWLFPTISNRRDTFDKFCALSLTHRNNGFITLLAPIRDYLTPKDPKSSPSLCATKDHYFRRLSAQINPRVPGFEEAQWITSEDANVEHLLDVFTSIDATSNDVWDACGHFMAHLYWHKPRQTVLGQRIEGLPDDHPSKPGCLFWLSQLFNTAGRYLEQKRLLTHALKLEKERGNDFQIAQTLKFLCDTNRMLGLLGEGIEQAKEALAIVERLGDTDSKAVFLVELADLLLDDEQLDDAEETALSTIDLVSGKGEEFIICRSHRTLGQVYYAKGDKEKAIHHFEKALEIASPFEFHVQLFWAHYQLAKLFFTEGELDNAQAHTDKAKSHVVGETYHFGWAMELQAEIWFLQQRLEDARSEVLRAIEVYEKFGSSSELESCRAVLRRIELAM